MSSPSDVNEIYLSSSPHFSAKRNTSSIMLCVIIALLPLCVYGVILFGLSAFLTIFVSVTSCVVFEWLFQKAAKQPVRVRDLSAIVTGIMLALVLPPATPVWMTMLGFPMTLSSVAIGDVALFGIPGEPFTGIGRGLKSSEDWSMVMPCCLTNGDEGYFPMRDSYDEGGYEARSSNYKVGVAERIIEEGLDILKALKAKA